MGKKLEEKVKIKTEWRKRNKQKKRNVEIH